MVLLPQRKPLIPRPAVASSNILVTENSELGNAARWDDQRMGCTCSQNITRHMKHTFCLPIKALAEDMVRLKLERVVARGPPYGICQWVNEESVIALEIILYDMI